MHLQQGDGHHQALHAGVRGEGRPPKLNTLQVPQEPGGGDPQDDRDHQGLRQHPHKGNHLIVLLPLKLRRKVGAL